MRTRLYRSARTVDPWFGQHSFWTTGRHHAEWFRDWEARTIPGIEPATIYTAEVDLTDAVNLQSSGVTPDKVIEMSPRLQELGVRWVLLHEGPIEGSLWVVAVYLGQEPVPARPFDAESGSPRQVSAMARSTRSSRNR